LIVAGYLADRAIGDPAHGHPVAVFGSLAERLEATMWRPTRRAGAAYVAVLAGAVVVAATVVDALLRARPVARRAAGALVLAFTLGGRSLAGVALSLAETVERGDVEGARRIVPALAGRDPAALDGAGLVRAAVESVAENTSDAVVAPLLWTAALGAPGAAAHRAVNTLDAMVGHRSPRHARFGWAAARLDDALNWPAARATVLLTALCAPVVGGDPRSAMRAAWRDGRRHPSPNAGRVEAAFAGALSVRLGGTTVYGHGTEERPVLGEGPPPGAADLRQAVRLSRAVGALACVVFAGVSRR
jgi:adenosylcobinamide-phosphate synthase